MIGDLVSQTDNFLNEHTEIEISVHKLTCLRLISFPETRIDIIVTVTKRHVHKGVMGQPFNFGLKVLINQVSVLD